MQAWTNKDFVELCKSGNIAEVERAITEGANVNSRDNTGTTALMYLVLNGYAEVAELLLKNSAEVNMKSNLGYTALMLASSNGYTDIAELLMRYGADVNARELRGLTALMLASWKGHAETAELLLKHVLTSTLKSMKAGRLCGGQHRKGIQRSQSFSANIAQKSKQKVIRLGLTLSQPYANK